MKRVLLVIMLLFLFAVPPAGAAPVAAPETPAANAVRISQVYGGGGATSGSPSYMCDYVELFNSTASAVSLNGWSIQYGSATGTGNWNVHSLPNITIQPNGYLLVQEGCGTLGGTLPTVDASGGLNMSASNGKVALLNSTTALNGACPTSASVQDKVGYGTANCSETSAAPALTTTTVALRAGGGCTDTDNNATDFTAGAPNPRNSSTAANTCTVVDTPPTVSSTVPANGATEVAPASSLTVNFSEPVTIANISSFFDIYCDAVLQPATGSGSGTAFTIDPTADLPTGATCTVTIKAAEVVDQDGTPDAMAANYVFSFTVASSDPCSQTYTHTYEIQGSGLTAAITGAVTTQGVVVGDYELPTGTGQLRGFYIQDATGDGNVATSDGLFIYDGGTNNVSLGQVVRVTGTASDYQDQTQVSSTGIVQCGTGSVTPVDVALPVASATALEPYEGMLVRFPQALYVTEHFQLGRFGQIVMSSSARLAQPTNVVAPGAPALALQAANDLNRIIVDDDNNIENPDPITFGRGGNPLSASNTLRGGDTVANLVGVLTYGFSGNATASGNAYRLRPLQALGGGSPNFVAANARPNTPAVAGRLRVSAGNLLNYFNTFGTGACTNGVGGSATDCRGADNQTEFDRQWPKTVANLVGGGADVIGFMEMENDGYGSTSAIQDLVNKLNNATAAGTYAFINADALTGQTNSLGTDAIKVGLLYKPAKVTPVGATAALNSVAFVNGGDGSQRNRPALAQAFEEVGTGERFIVVVNHLKSKGSACDDPDAGDGQGNCNIVRTNAANVLTAWLAGNPTGTGDPDIVIVGDLNSYAKEDPITAIKNAGYINLPETLIGANAYSYVFDGQWGYLDHALGSAGFAAQVAGIQEWHINADEPSVLDYNTNYKTAGQISSLYAADRFRASDHDPIIVGLNLLANDLSDLATPYGAAWHTPDSLKLGATWAAGHSTVGGGTNDGVVRTSGFTWSDVNGGSVDVTVNGAAGYVTGWIDWDKNNSFDDPAERVFMNEAFTAGQTRTITFAVPVAPSGIYNARFRVYPTAQTAAAVDAAPSPIGGATGGEVEDYAWNLNPNAVSLRTFGATGAAPAWPAVASLGLLGAVVLVWRRRGSR